MIHHVWQPLPDQRAISQQAAERYALTTSVREQRRQNGHRSLIVRLRDALTHYRTVGRNQSHESGASMNHLTPDEATPFTIHGVSFQSFARSATGAKEITAWRAEFGPHTPGQAHRMSHEEILFVLDGPLDIAVDDNAFQARGPCRPCSPAA